jgi:hypothetical protein
MDNVTKFPNRFSSESIRHEFELKNKFVQRPEIDNPAVKHLRMTIRAKKLRLTSARRKK